MRYKLLGRSGLRVSELCLGTMTFGREWGWGADAGESRRIFNCFAEAGGNFIDTADAYTNGSSERLVGECIRSARDKFVVATKYGMTKRPELQRSGNARKHMVRSVDDSLRRLATDYIDLYYLHFWDYTTLVDEVMRGLDDLVSAGKVLHVAFSNTPAWIIMQAQMLAECRAWAPLVAVQIEYSLAERTAEREVMPMSQALDLGITAWSPLAGGILTGKYRNGAAQDQARLSRAEVDERHVAISEVVEGVAGECGATPAGLALAWVARQQRWGPLMPIIGARTAEQLQENLRCLEVDVGPEQWRMLDQATAIEPGFPHGVLNDPRSRWHATGGFDESLDTHRAWKT